MDRIAQDNQAFRIKGDPTEIGLDTIVDLRLTAADLGLLVAAYSMTDDGYGGTTLGRIQLAAFALQQEDWRRSVDNLTSVGLLVEVSTE